MSLATRTVPYHMKVSFEVDEISTTSTLSEVLFCSVSKCCFCIPLRTGCFILGYLNLVLNTYDTFTVLITTIVVGYLTYGFDYSDPEDHRQVLDQVPDKPFLNRFGIFAFILCANVAWLMINVACLVGLHKKRPGPIRIYVGLATGRLLLYLAIFMYHVITDSLIINITISDSVDIVVTAYFILVYYIYAKQLEREHVQREPDVVSSDSSFI